MIFGGVSINVQKKNLQRGCDIVVATPGRLLDHLQQGTVDLGDVQILVLDEADRMLDMGFIRDMRKIFKQLPQERQTLLFSATFNKDIRALASDLLKNPAEVQKMMGVYTKLKEEANLSVPQPMQTYSRIVIWN